MEPARSENLIVLSIDSISQARCVMQSIEAAAMLGMAVLARADGVNDESVIAGIRQIVGALPTLMAG